MSKDNIKDFEATAKKYGIDFALKKDAMENPPRYIVFFKGRDADVMTQAFKEYTAKSLNNKKKPSIKKILATLKEKAEKPSIMTELKAAREARPERQPEHKEKHHGKKIDHDDR